MGRTVGARALAVFTQRGRTARSLASHRTGPPVLAFTSETMVRSNLALTWGVETFVAPVVQRAEDALALVEQTMLGLGRAVAGDKVVILAGQAGTTNTVPRPRAVDVVAAPRSGGAEGGQGRARASLLRAA